MRARLLLLPTTLLISLLIATYRLTGFISLFYTHSGVSLTQEEIWDAHFGASAGGVSLRVGVGVGVGVSESGNGDGKVEGKITEVWGDGDREKDWGKEAGDEREVFVPKIIHQVFHNWKEPGNETLPEDWEMVRRGCGVRNGDWEFMLWTERTSHEFIKQNYPWFLSTYESYHFPVQRVDTVRYFLLRHYGGIYLDLDNGCLQNLEPLLYYPAFITDGGRGALSNNILASSPLHPFWVLLTDSLQAYNYNYLFPYVTISYASGQWFVTSIWEKYHREIRKMEQAGLEIEEKEQIIRVMMDDRVKEIQGGGKWVFFTQERGGTWVNWDNYLFLWVGDHLGLLGVGGVVFIGGGWWGLRWCFGGRKGYRKVEGKEDA